MPELHVVILSCSLGKFPSVYYTERKPKNKNGGGRPGNEARYKHFDRSKSRYHSGSDPPYHDTRQVHDSRCDFYFVLRILD